MWHNLGYIGYEISGYRHKLIKILTDNQTDGIFDTLIKARQDQDVDFEKGKYYWLKDHYAFRII